MKKKKTADAEKAEILTEEAKEVKKPKKKKKKRKKKSKVKIVAIIIIFLVLIAAGCYGLTFTDEAQYQMGIMYYEKSDYNAALKHFSKCADYKDTWEYLNDIYYSIGYGYYAEGDFDAALENLLKADDYELSKGLIKQINVLSELQGTWRSTLSDKLTDKDLIISGGKIVNVAYRFKESEDKRNPRGPIKEISVDTVDDKVSVQFINATYSRFCKKGDVDLVKQNKGMYFEIKGKMIECYAFSEKDNKFKLYCKYYKKNVSTDVPEAAVYDS